MRINRRQLGKGLTAAAAAAALGHLAPAEPTPAPLEEAPAQWVPVFPGIWRARLGTPEMHTPVSLRLVAPAAEALGALPAPAAPPLPAPLAAASSRGCTFSLPLGPGEQVYGFGLQLLSLEQRGKKRTIRVNADPKGDSRRLAMHPLPGTSPPAAMASWSIPCARPPSIAETRVRSPPHRSP